MRHLKHTAKLGRNCGHRKALLVNLACSILEHEQVKTPVVVCVSSVLFPKKSHPPQEITIIKIKKIEIKRFILWSPFFKYPKFRFSLP